MTENRSGAAADAQSVEAALREAATTISAAHTLLDQDQTIDLGGLERHIEDACKALGGLPAEDRERLKPLLVMLIDGLNSLSKALSERHGDLTESLKGIGARHQAFSAYKPR